ncbi:MAG: aminoglycoside phosphotransferase family protein [Candidatus Planktophila sp.]|nr:aminoglycoside phosphotransferase family protein [Candidatus Planktophila sp.]
MELLNESTVIDYLIDHGVVTSTEDPRVEILTGGVSNTVLSITTKYQDLVLKQALPELKVAQKWEADPRRAIVEADALRLFHEISPTVVPKLVFIDPIEFVLIMERLPLGSSVWKSDLLTGIFNPMVPEVLGKTLAEWHHFGAEHPKYQSKFKEDTLFEQLRVDPFYRFVGDKNPYLQKSIFALIDELKSDNSTIVHGDFSPKNIMVTPGEQVYVLDFEVMHVGNPIFDLAFLVSHLLCKFFRAENDQMALQLASLADKFLSKYEASHSISSSLPLHTALIALARVEGKSPVDYLNKSAQVKLQKFTKNILRNRDVVDARKLFELSAR